MTFFELMALPFAECLVLVGIHSYLGIHVLKRKVIFVDLAFAQIAALGTTVGFLFGLHPTGPGAYVFSLLFAIIAAAVFAITRLRDERIPQEAIIGLTYALAAAVAILVIDRAPHGAEHIKEIMAGSILWVRASDVAIAAGVYSLIGLYHYVFREKFLLISEDHEKARKQGINVRLWDFLFYVSFGVIISLSVRTAGVLLVFVFLVVPAMMGMILTRNLKLQLAIGWGAGTLVSIGGLVASDLYDLPAGPAVVGFYGLVLVITAVAVYLFRGGDSRSPVRVGSGLAVAATVVLSLYFLGTSMAGSHFWVHGPGHDHEHEHDYAAAAEKAHELDEEARQLLGGERTEAIEAVVDSSVRTLLTELMRMDVTQKEQALSELTDAVLLHETLRATTDDEIAVSVAKRLFALSKTSKGRGKGRGDGPKMGRRRGVKALIRIMKINRAPLFRSEAHDLLAEAAGNDFGFEPFDEPDTEENKAALAAMEEWLEETFKPHRHGK